MAKTIDSRPSITASTYDDIQPAQLEQRLDQTNLPQKVYVQFQKNIIAQVDFLQRTVPIGSVQTLHLHQLEQAGAKEQVE